MSHPPWQNTRGFSRVDKPWRQLPSKFAVSEQYWSASGVFLSCHLPIFFSFVSLVYSSIFGCLLVTGYLHLAPFLVQDHLFLFITRDSNFTSAYNCHYNPWFKCLTYAYGSRIFREYWYDIFPLGKRRIAVYFIINNT